MKMKLFLLALCVSVSLQAQVFDSSTEATMYFDAPESRMVFK